MASNPIDSRRADVLILYVRRVADTRNAIASRFFGELGHQRRDKVGPAGKDAISVSVLKDVMGYLTSSFFNASNKR